MENDELAVKIIELNAKLDAIYVSAEKTRKYIKWTGIISIGVIVIPLLIFPFVLPAFFSAEGVDTSSLQGL
jgi:hypothetical protein